jgi:CRP/FNR family transcriptional regulator, anaerobic regulatory protein
MLLEKDSPANTPDSAFYGACAHDGASAPATFESVARQLQLVRRPIRERQVVIRAGQPMRCVYFVHAGCFKTTLASADGREKITGFRMRGDLIGLESLGAMLHGCDATALDTGELWEIPVSLYRGSEPGSALLRDHLTNAMAAEIRRDWQWMLSIGTLSAEQRVVAFLLDLADRQQALGYSASQLMLRMTRADLGNFLDLQLETVTRVLSRLAAEGLIDVQRREIRIVQLPQMRQRLLSNRLPA